MFEQALTKTSAYLPSWVITAMLIISFLVFILKLLMLRRYKDAEFTTPGEEIRAIEHEPEHPPMQQPAQQPSEGTEKAI